MFADYGKELLRNGIAEVKAGNLDAARRYLDRAIYASRTHDVMAEAWFWMGEIETDSIAKKKAYENCLSHDLHHARARRALAILEGKLKKEDVIDPDHLPSAPEGLNAADAKRFMCPKCGGRMSFAPDGSNALVCDYCSRNQTLDTGTANEKDFVIAMATMKGHGKPLQEQVFHCQGCGSEFILPSKQISVTCAYCLSPHVVSLEKRKDLLAPDGIIPHTFDQRHAIKLLIDWVETNGIEPQKKVDLPRGLYLPLWTFDLGGSIEYVVDVVEDDESLNRRAAHRQERRRVQRRDEYPIIEDDLPLPASRKPSSVFLELIPTFSLKSIRAYDPRFLADWPAEVYDVSMADASLDARSQTFKKYKKELPHILGMNMVLVSASSANLMVESFKLNLLPVWMTEIPFNGREHLVLINGQNGMIESDIPVKSSPRKDDDESEKGSLMDFLADLLGN